MQIATILNRKGHKVATIAPDATLKELAATLRDKKYGAMVVSADGKTVDGIVSERDIVARLTDFGPGFLKEPVQRIMSKDVVSIAPDQTIDDCMSLMTDRRIRHLPVVEDGVLVGIVSIGDIVKAHIDAISLEAASLREYIATG